MPNSSRGNGPDHSSPVGAIPVSEGPTKGPLSRIRAFSNGPDEFTAVSRRSPHAELPPLISGDTLGASAELTTMPNRLALGKPDRDLRFARATMKAWKLVGPDAKAEELEKHLEKTQPEALLDYQLRTPRIESRWRWYRRHQPKEWSASAGPARPASERDDRSLLDQRQAHSRELATLVFSRPELLLSGRSDGLYLNMGQADQLRYARAHFGHYPAVRHAEEQLRAAESETHRLIGEEDLLDLFHGIRSLGGLVGERLLLETRRVLRELYPGLPEHDGVGPVPPEYTCPRTVGADLWREMASRTVGGPPFLELTVRWTQAGWVVGRSPAQTYAVVSERDRSRVAEFQAALDAAAQDPELRRLYTEAQAAQERLGSVRDTFLTTVRQLGTQLRHGELIRGTCELGY